MIKSINCMTGEKLQWSGGKTSLCTNCHRLFTGPDGFDAHFTVKDDGVNYEMICRDPATITRPKDGQPMFERVEKPGWNPDHAWRRNRPGRVKRDFAA